MSDEINVGDTLSYALHNNLFISVLPGEVVFGLPDFNGQFQTNKCFHFEVDDFHILYNSLVEIIQFFADANPNKSKIKLSNDTVYYWTGLVALQNNTNKAFLKLGIEINSEITVEILFNERQFMTFLSVLKECITSCLYLNQESYTIFKILSKDNLQNIMKFIDNFKYAQGFIIKKLDKFHKNILKLTNIHEVLKYYQNILIIVHKLQFFGDEIQKDKELIKNQILNPSNTSINSSVQQP